MLIMNTDIKTIHTHWKLNFNFLIFGSGHNGHAHGDPFQKHSLTSFNYVA